MKEIISSARNIEKAIEKGLEELGAKFEDVNIEVLSEGGFFSKAKVKITLTEKEPLPEENVIIAEEKEEVKADEDGITVALDKKQAKKEEKEKAKEVKKEEKKEIKKEKKAEKENKSSQEFLNDLFKICGIDCDVTKQEDEKYIKYIITGENLSGVIGNKGENLSALQYITSLVKTEEEKGKKIILDAGGYKENRAEKVKDIAIRAIEKVKETGRWQKLKPMTAYERRIVHQIINETEGVTGESSGVEPNRYLTIYPEKNN